MCNLFLSIARFAEGDPAILKGQGGGASMEISTRDITKFLRTSKVTVQLSVFKGRVPVRLESPNP